MMPIHRRHFLTQSSAVGIGSLLGSRFCHAVANHSPTGPFKRCLVLWMEGGPSQLDTFDPKVGQTRGSVETNVSDVRFAETLADLAPRADELCLIRSVGSREGEHTRATELLHTGFSPVPSFPRPSLGSMVSSTRADSGFPRFVTLGGTGFGPAFLGSENGPFVIQDIGAARRQLARLKEKRNALEMVSQFNDRYARTTYSQDAIDRSSEVKAVRGLLNTPFPNALDLAEGKAADRQRYGDHEFGQRVLTAKRLLQIGVPFVEAHLGGWDTHIDNDRRTEILCRRLQQPWLALMDDLQSSGMWDDTLVVWMGEFGRTPLINGRSGRDHFPETIPIVLSGGNLGGKIIGQTSADGLQRMGQRHSVADLMATLLVLLGIDVDQTYTTDFGSPTSVTDDGEPIQALVEA